MNFENFPHEYYMFMTGNLNYACVVKASEVTAIQTDTAAGLVYSSTHVHTHVHTCTHTHTRARVQIRSRLEAA